MVSMEKVCRVMEEAEIRRLCALAVREAAEDARTRAEQLRRRAESLLAEWAITADQLAPEVARIPRAEAPPLKIAV